MPPLLDDIRRHAPADEIESRHRDSLLALLETAPDPFARDAFVPGHVTASCFIVDPAAARLLLHHHRRLNRWLQMGGHLEPDETPAAAARREGIEESGLGDLRLTADIVDLDVHAIPPGRGEPEHFHFDVRYVAATAQPWAIRVVPAESNDLAWFALGDAEPRMNEAASSRVIRKIERLLKEGALS
jgi:8-oxo-dGTP pyrophosphatase MutT (NUDIX family)